MTKFKVVEAESESGNQGIDINGEKRHYQAALHQEIAALETLEQNPIKLFNMDDKSYGTIESRESDMYYAESIGRTINDAGEGVQHTDYKSHISGHLEL